jgi:hypothetical protein
MLRILVRRQFETLLRGDSHWPAKILAAGDVGLTIAAAALIAMWFEGKAALSFLEVVATLFMMPTLFMLAASILARADVVRSRVRTGAPVGRFSRLFFAAGAWSVLAWVVAVLLLVGFPLAVWVGSLAAGIAH